MPYEPPRSTTTHTIERPPLPDTRPRPWEAETTWSQWFAGRPDVVRRVRAFVAAHLDGMAGADDIVLMVDELATNARCRTCSGLLGGTFTVTVRRTPRCVRVEVTGAGPHALDATHSADEHGRSLLIVSALATRWGLGIRDDHHVAWFEHASSPTGIAVPCLRTEANT